MNEQPLLCNSQHGGVIWWIVRFDCSLLWLELEFSMESKLDCSRVSLREYEERGSIHRVDELVPKKRGCTLAFGLPIYLFGLITV